MQHFKKWSQDMGLQGQNLQKENNQTPFQDPSHIAFLAAQKRLAEARVQNELMKKSVVAQKTIVAAPTVSDSTALRPVSQVSAVSDDKYSAQTIPTLVPEYPPQNPDVLNNRAYPSSTSQSYRSNPKVAESTQKRSVPKEVAKTEDESKETLKVFLKQLEGMIAANDSLLNEATAPMKPGEELAAVDGEQVHELKKRNYLKEALRQQISQKKVFKMPLWRHKLAGQDNPPQELVMKGKSLFKAIAVMIINIVVRPWLALREKQEKIKASEMDKLMKTMLLYIEPTSQWIGKRTKIPVISLAYDKLVDLSEVFERNGLRREQSIIHLRVRLRSIIENMSNSEAPPEHIMKLILTLTDDGNFFGPEFLFDCEKSRLDFNKYSRHLRIKIITNLSLYLTKNSFLD